MERLFSDRRLLERVRVGPLGKYVGLLIDDLLKDGYLIDSVRGKIRIISGFSAWLLAKGLTAADINYARTREFLEQRKQGHMNGDGLVLRRLVQKLEQMGVIARESGRTPTPLETLMDSFSAYLQQQRCLAPRTITNYGRWAQRLLLDRFGNAAIECSTLRSADVIGFVHTFL